MRLMNIEKASFLISFISLCRSVQKRPKKLREKIRKDLIVGKRRDLVFIKSAHE